MDKIYQELTEFYSKRFELIKNEELNFDEIDSTLVSDKNFEIKSKNPILIVGEAPGANEVRHGIPFCGMAGKNLLTLISHSGLKRESDFIITNAFPFRTFQKTDSGIKNRTPTKKELEVGAKLLKIELEILKPKVILILGNSAKKAFLKLDDKTLVDTLKKMQNNTFELTKTSYADKITIGFGFHPSPLVFNQKSKREQLLDFFGKLPQ